MNGFHFCTRDVGAWVYRPEATIVAVSDFAEGTVIDAADPCLPCALYDALLDRRARIVAPNASGVRVPQPAVVGARIKAAFANASKVETRPVAAVHPGAPPLPDAAPVESLLSVPSKAAAVVALALPKKGQTLLFGAVVMAAAPAGPKPPTAFERVKATANVGERAPLGPRPVEDYGDFGAAPANDARGTVDDKVKRRANLARLTAKKGE